MKQIITAMLSGLLLFCANSEGKTKWSQEMLPGTRLFPTERLSKANWIWHSSDKNATQECYFRLKLNLPEEPVKAIAYATFEPASIGNFYVNGKEISRGADTRQPRFRGHVRAASLDLLPALKKGENVIAVYVKKYPASTTYGLICGGDIVLKSGKVIRLGTDEEFLATPFKEKDWNMPGFDDSKWKHAIVRGGVRFNRLFRYGDVPRMYCSDSEYQNYLKIMAEGSKLPAGLENEPASKARIVYNGITPGIEVNGKVIPPFILKHSIFTNSTGPIDEDDDCVLKMYRAGVRIFNLGYTHGSLRLHDGTGRLDYSEVDRRARRILALCPDAKIILAPFYDVDFRWIDANPDELVGFANPDGGQIYDLYWGNPKVPSFASPKFQKVLTDELRDLAAFANSKPWGKRVIGVMFAYGPSADGMPFACQTGMPDTGKRMTEAFRKYLKNKYKTVEALRKAWNEPGVTFETAAVPNMAERFGPTKAFLHDVKAERKLMDYYHCYHEVFAEFQLNYCRTVKEVFPGRLSAIFFGDFLLPYASVGLTAHFEKILNDPALDIMYCTSLDYFKRSGMHRNIHHSFHRAGKLTSIEADLRTHVGVQEGTVEMGWAFKTPAETRSGIRKVMCNALMQGGTAHFNPHNYLYHDRFNCPEVYETIEDGIKLWERLFKEKQAAETEEVIAVWDPASKIYQGYPIYGMNSAPHQALISGTLEAMDFSGIPYKLMTLKDYLAQDKNYKVTVFLNLFTVTEEVKKQIHARVRKPGNTVIWNYAAGYASPDGFSEKAMSELTGINYKVSMKPKLWCVKNPFGNLERSSGKANFHPWIYTTEKDVEVIATYADGGEAANVMKTLPDGSISVVLGVPMSRWEYWPYLLTLSKVHQYAEGTVLVRANERMLMVSPYAPGEYTIRLPRKATVIDLFGDMEPLVGVKEFKLKAKDHQTRLFELR